MDGGDGVQGGDHQHGHVHGDEHRHGGGQEDGHPVDRLIEWTGERCVPWTGDLQVVYEHYHRYHLAAGVVAGKRVLDLASGEGYGAALMARDAEQVVGLEIDPAAVAHSRETYPLDGLEFVEGTMLDLSRFPEGSFDVVTCFEALEHVVEHDELIAQVRRVLAPGGLFFTSTPDRLVYTGHLHQHNPFHVRELSLAEFQELLGGTFTNATIWGQAVSVGSLITPVEERGAAAEVVALEHEGEEWVRKPAYAPTYYLAVASDGPLPELPGQSVLVDVNIELVRGAQGAAQARTAEAQALAAEAESLRDELARVRTVLGDERERALEQAEEHAAAISEALSHAEAMVKQRNDAFAAAAVLVAERDEARGTVAATQASRLYRLALRYYALVERLAPAGSTRRALYSRTGRGAVRTVRRLAPSQPDAPAEAGATMAAAVAAPIPRLPGSVAPSDTSLSPLVSIVIPVHGKWEVTAQCLRSFVANPPTVPYEVVVVDDASPDETRARLAEVPGIVTVALDANRGFVGAVNAGIERSRGEFVAMLNNDTEIQPGWLEALVDAAQQPDIGLVGSKLVYPDGRLQEAGGIIFDNGGGWNYGRFEDPDLPRYNVARDVDYCSGAAILIRRDLLSELGNLDEYFAPAYFDDVDLAFRVRQRGLRVIYEPSAVVVHHEGVSHGTDESSGIKRYQAINREKFVARWSDELAEHYPQDSGLVEAAARRRAGRGTIVVIDHHVPRPDEDSGSVRMFGLLTALRRLGWSVVFVPDNRVAGDLWGARLLAEGIEVFTGPEPIEDFLRSISRRVSAVIGARVMVAWPYLSLVRRALPGVPFIFDTVDLHHVREEREADLSGSPSDAGRAAATRNVELALVQASEETLVVSPVEVEILAERAPGARVAVVPNVHEQRDLGPGPEFRDGILFVGSFAHPPNADAVRWFVTEVLPLVREQVPDARFRVVGKGVPDDLLSIDADGVEFTGWLPTLDEAYRATRVAVAPLRYGAGIKGKVGEALSYGVPVVGTSVAMEGMGIEHGVTGWIGNTPVELAEGIVTLLRDDDVWRSIATAGAAAIEESLGVQRFEALLAGALSAVGLKSEAEAHGADG